MMKMVQETGMEFVMAGSVYQAHFETYGEIAGTAQILKKPPFHSRRHRTLAVAPVGV